MSYLSNMNGRPQPQSCVLYAGIIRHKDISIIKVEREDNTICASHKMRFHYSNFATVPNKYVGIQKERKSVVYSYIFFRTCKEYNFDGVFIKILIFVTS